MATKTAVGSVVSWNSGRKTAWASQGWVDLDTAQPWNGQYSAIGGTYNHRVCFEIKTPNFTGTATNVHFTWKGHKQSSTAGNTNAAIQPTFKTYNDSTGSHSEGAVGIGSMYYNSTTSGQREIDIPITGTLKPNTTYYLYLYTDSTGVVYYARHGSDYYSLTVTYEEPEAFTIYFDPQGGTVNPTSITKQPGVGITLPTPTRPGYNFLYWADGPDGIYMNTYDPGFYFTDDVGQDFDLYAYWEEIPYSSYTVNHYTQNTSFNGYDLNDTETFSGDVGTSINIASQQNSITGFTFDYGEITVTAPADKIEILSSLPEIRQNAASARVGNNIYLFGGYNKNTIVKFDINTQTSTTLSTTLPDSSENIGAAAVGTKIYLFGGSAASGAIRTFDTTTNTLSTLSTRLPSSLHSMGVAAVGTKIYLFGGYANGASSQIHEFDTTNNTLTTLSATLPSACYQIGAAAVGDKIYLFGGWNGSSSGIINTIRVFEASIKTVTTLSATLTMAARGVFASAVGKTIYIFGGYNNGVMTTIQAFNTEGNSISTLSVAMPYGGCFLGGASQDNIVYILGGYSLGSTCYKFTAGGTHSIMTDTTTILSDGSRVINLYYNRNTYTISYNANGHGTAPSNQIKTYGIDLFLRSFISQQTAIGYKVSFNANSGSSTPSALTSTIYYDQTYWNTNSSGTGTNYSSGGTYSANSAATLYAIWKTTNGSVTLPSAISRANGTSTRTVTFNANGGSCSTTSLDSTAIITYTFSKWAAGSTSGTTYSAGASFTPTAATTMYATWNSSTGSYSSITLPTPTRTGYTFKGWSTSSSATSGTTGSYTPSSSVTLYATWQINTYTISYNANGYGTAPASQTKTYGTNLTLQSFIANQSATGYKVSYNANGGNSTPSAQTSTRTMKQTYWNTNSSGTGTNYSSGGTYTTNAGATLYAIWSGTNNAITLASAISKSNTTANGYTVTFNANGGVCDTSSLTATNTIKYAFNKWAAGSTSGTTYSAGTSYTPTGAITMYATWNSSTINGSINLPTPTRVGYTFMGWSTSSTATSGTTGSYTPSGNVTLYATWKANGAVQIGTGTGHQTALVYIHNGTEYVLAIPYVHDGTEWKMAIGG